MKKYRVKKIGQQYFIQERRFFFFWKIIAYGVNEDVALSIVDKFNNLKKRKCSCGHVH